ncbi:MAG TPA: SRPBCC domain-containing protein [Pseudonocardiaceae bacterium]|jgi:uncharacterized protein YndB with AHSA1/START domain
MSQRGDGAGATIRLERTFHARAQDVFDAWTSVEVLRRWWHAGRDWETPHAELDLRPGGAIRITMRDPHRGVNYGGGGEFTEIEPPRRLAFTWTWDDDPSTQQLVEVDFTEHGEHTTVRLTNSGVPGRSTEGHVAGWEVSFVNLDGALQP